MSDARSSRPNHRSLDRISDSKSSRALSGILLALTLAFFAACVPGDGHDDSGERSARRFISVGSAPAGGTFFVVGGALAEVASAHGEGWTATAEATKGSRENIRRLIAGELDFALSNAAITYFGVRGERGWDQAYPVRSVMTLAPNVGLFVTPRSSGITKISDLAGRRVVMGPAGAGFGMFIGPILEAHGISLDDVTVLNNTQSGTVDMLADGSADAAFLGGAVPTPSIVQAATSMDLVYVPFDAEARDSLIADFPFFRPTTIAAGTYRGLDEDYAGLVTGAMHLITAEGADEDMVYAFTKAIYENSGEVVERHPAGRSIRAENVVDDRGTPFHPGAVRFYREIGIWPNEG